MGTKMNLNKRILKLNGYLAYLEQQHRDVKKQLKSLKKLRTQQLYLDAKISRSQMQSKSSYQMISQRLNTKWGLSQKFEDK